MFKKNVHYIGPAKLSPWRKIAMGTWRTCGDPSVYGSLEIDASQMQTLIKEQKEKGIRLTPTVIVAKAVAMSLREYPMMNTVLRMGRLYQRKDVDIFLQISPEGKEDNLSGKVIRNCDKKSLTEIAQELHQSANRIKKGDDFEFKKMKKLLHYVPPFLVAKILNLTSSIMYGLNLWSPLLNAPRDGFGSFMVTSVGMLGIENGYAPLVPYSRCPALMSVGEIRDKAVVIEGEIVIRPMLTVGVTLDHRHMDGKGASYMIKALRAFLENPA